jgi:hypothetical protein
MQMSFWKRFATIFRDRIVKFALDLTPRRNRRIVAMATPKHVFAALRASLINSKAMSDKGTDDEQPE